MSEMIKFGGGATCYWQIVRIKATEQMKAAQNQQQLWYYLLRNESAQNDDGRSSHDPAFLSDRISTGGLNYLPHANSGRAAFAAVCVGDNPGWRTTLVQKVIDRAHQISIVRGAAINWQR